jgi:hypothetical protein
VPILNNNSKVDFIIKQYLNLGNHQGTSPALLNNGARVQIVGNPPPVVQVSDNSNINNNLESSDNTTNN